MIKCEIFILSEINLKNCLQFGKIEVQCKNAVFKIKYISSLFVLYLVPVVPNDMTKI